jgi:hypothetical protein
VTVGAAYVVGADELRKIRAHLKKFLPVRILLPDPINENDIMTASGVYAFLKRGQVWAHLYLGKSFERLGPRASEQLHLRQWATHLLLFPLPGLRPETLAVIEKRLLRICAKTFFWAYLDNERDISAPHPDPFLKRGIYPDLDDLVFQIAKTVLRGLEPSRGRRKKLSPTHTLKMANGDVYGMASRRGRWTYLLPGSRLPSRYPNYRAIKKDPAALERLEGFYRRGKIAWRPRRGSRQAGFVVTEPIQFRKISSAARMLYVGEKVTEGWELITPKWDA